METNFVISIAAGDEAARFKEFAASGLNGDIVLADLVDVFSGVFDVGSFWEAVDGAASDTAPVLVRCCQPLASHVVAAHPSSFRHEWIWQRGGGHGSVLVFSRSGDPVPASSNDGGPRGCVLPHMTQEDLWERLLREYASPGMLALGWRAGYGQAAAACKRLGIRYAGVDSDPARARAAMARVEDTDGPAPLNRRR